MASNFVENVFFRWGVAGDGESEAFSGERAAWSDGGGAGGVSGKAGSGLSRADLGWGGRLFAASSLVIWLLKTAHQFRHCVVHELISQCGQNVILGIVECGFHDLRCLSALHAEWALPEKLSELVYVPFLADHATCGEVPDEHLV